MTLHFNIQVLQVQVSLLLRFRPCFQLQLTIGFVYRLLMQRVRKLQSVFRNSGRISKILVGFFTLLIIAQLWYDLMACTSVGRQDLYQHLSVVLFAVFALINQPYFMLFLFCFKWKAEEMLIVMMTLKGKKKR